MMRSECTPWRDRRQHATTRLVSLPVETLEIVELKPSYERCCRRLRRTTRGQSPMRRWNGETMQKASWRQMRILTSLRADVA
eukprot:COSAG02_NODE_2173_length_9590_cov_39.075229_6_plen_82_part_00